MHRTEPFWMIYGLGQGAPNHIHETRDSAKAEAERLARAHPGTRFYVLASVACAVKADVEFRHIDPCDIPF